MQLQLEARATYLYAALSGPFELAAAQALSREFLLAGAAQGLHYFLVDALAVQGRLTASERFEYAEYVANQISAEVAAGRMKRPRLAYVMRPPVADPLHYGLTVAVNRGVDAVVTPDYEKALHWLTGPPAK